MWRSFLPYFRSGSRRKRRCKTGPRITSAARRALIFDALEDRNLLAVTAQLVIDIEPGAAGSNPLQLTALNETLLFQRNTADIWRSNGTDSGTVLVKNLNIPAEGYPSYLSELTNVNGALYYVTHEYGPGT